MSNDDGASLHGQAATYENIPSSGVHLTPRVTLASLKAVVSAEYGVSVAMLESNAQDRRWTQARHLCMWMARIDLFLSYPQIARAFGNRDHSTILAACRSIGEKQRAGGDVAERIARVRAALHGEPIPEMTAPITIPPPPAPPKPQKSRRGEFYTEHPLAEVLRTMVIPISAVAEAYSALETGREVGDDWVRNQVRGQTRMRPEVAAIIEGWRDHPETRPEINPKSNMIAAARHYRSREAPETGPVVRKCLRCENSFRSEWIGNRMCKSCKERI